MTRRARTAAALAAAAVATLSVACRPDTVRVTFEPRPGAVVRHEVTVESSSTTTVGDAAPRVATDTVELVVDQRVVRRTGAGGAVVAVRVTDSGGGTPLARYTTELDATGTLVAVRDVEGFQPDVGGTALPEVLPTAITPPARPLRLGDRWRIDRRVTLAGAPVTRLTGTGRLATLGVVRGRDVATADTVTRLPLRRRVPSGEGEVVLDGVQRTEARTTYALDGGVVEAARTRTTGRFSLSLVAAGGTAVVPGELRVDVTTRVRRRPSP